MVLFPTEEKWNEWGVSEDAHKFLVLRWMDLFDERTYDSWQIRSSNIVSILQEVRDAIRIVERVHQYHVNIGALLEEAEAIVSSDPVVRSDYQFLPGYLVSLRQLYETRVRPHERARYDEFRATVDVAVFALEGYAGHASALLRDLVGKGTHTHYKHELYPLIMALAVELHRQGYSVYALREASSVLIDPDGGKFTDRLERFLGHFSGKDKNYRCRFFVAWAGEESVLNEFGFRVVGEIPAAAAGTEDATFYSQDAGAPIVEVEQNALDPYSARFEAEKRIGVAVAAAKLFKMTKDIGVLHEVALVGCDGQNLAIGPNRTWRKYLRDAKRFEGGMARLAGVMARLETEERQLFQAALQYHQIAVSATSDEVRLVNLWIALESLVQHGDGSIIERVCRSIAAVSTTNYGYQIIRSLPTALAYYWRRNPPRELIKLLDESDERYFHPMDLGRCITDRKDGELITRLLEFAAPHPLLVYRVYRLWGVFGHSADNHLRFLERHRNNIRWQLRRIYRARNEISHNGRVGLDTCQLIQHLHSYFVITCHAILRDMHDSPGLGLAGALERRRRLDDIMTEHLRGDAKIDWESLFSYNRLLAKRPGRSFWDHSDLRGSAP